MNDQKVAFLLEFPTLLGGERAWLELLPLIEGIESIAVARAHGPLSAAIAAQGVPIVPFDWHGGPPEQRAAALAPLLSGAGIGIVHANSLTTSLTAAALAPLIGARAFAHARDIMKLSAARVERINSLEKIIAVSAAVKNSLETQGVDPGRIALIPDGIDAAGAFDPARVEDRLRTAAGLPDGVPTVGLVGQLVRRKDPLTFLKAFQIVSEKFPAARAVLVGSRHSRKDEAVEYEKEIRQAAGPAAIFLGERDDAPSLIKGMTVAALTSRQEPQSRVILEAMALERPVVASDAGGSPELIRDGREGFLFPVGDAEAAANRICAILSDPALAARMGAAGRRRVLSEFTPGAAASAISALFART